MISREGGQQIYDNISKLTYSDLFSITSLGELCRKSDTTWAWYKANDDREGTLETAYRQLHQYIVSTKFYQIRITFMVFSHMSDTEIVNIFKNINTTGVQLSTQDILKATSSLTFYFPTEIRDYNVLFNIINTYVTKQNEKEALAVTISSNSLTAFDVLFATQMWMNEKYPYIMDSPGGKKDIDLIFKLYNLFHKELQNKDVRKMDKFCRDFMECCENINEVHQEFYIVGIESLSLALNKQYILFADMMMHGFNKNKVKIVLLYDILSQRQEKSFQELNPIKDVASSSAVEANASRRKAGDTIQNVPCKDAMRELLEYLIEKNNNPCNYNDKIAKYKPTKVEKILLSIYFDAYIPPRVTRENTLQLDHIIPVSTAGWTGALDINRIGNRILIDKTVNCKKSNKPITDAFLIENKMHYYNFPSEAEYTAIVSHGNIINHEAYDTFCRKREQAYIDIVLEILYKT